ncbi:histidine kinase N-terminal 7TM domain-containing protein [Halopenitus sp. POP-27]|uniref:histidine kinase N-terminal 7TM domain-containing protein n=1 Tax=Halopenitus sp. POP-27 TaxID=2994425 RepID=UPI002469C2F6|nr:histidine kinase N-terminal 7TM domain-containing protein [Halopenitus sp. POP-27]
MIPLTVLKAALICTVAIGMAGGLIAWRERPTPGSVPLAVLLAGQCWWSVTLLFRIDAVGIAAKGFWVDVSWVGIAVIPVAWLFFSLEYSGYHEYVQPRYVAVASIVPLCIAVIGATNTAHELMYVRSTLVEINGATMLDRTPGPWFWIAAGYTYLLGLLGTLPLLELITSDVLAFRAQSLALIVGIVVPWLTNVLYLLGTLPTYGVDPTPIGFAVSGVAYLGALTRFRLFGTNPAPIRYARRLAFDRMEEGAIVLDSNGYVVELNERAATFLRTDPDDILGRAFADALPQVAGIVDCVGPNDRMVLEADDGTRAYDVSACSIVDYTGRTIGRSITLHDVSAHLRRQRRLTVLNRVFRHNVRTTTQLILGCASEIDDDAGRIADRIEDHAMAIEDLSEKVRRAIDLFDRDRADRRPLPLDSILRDAIDSARDARPAVSVDYDGVPDDVYVDELLTVVFEDLIENAAEHNTTADPAPHIQVDVRIGEPESGVVRVIVADNGPGIDDEELAVLEEEAETPLRHGSGLGLSLITWGIDIVGGRIEFADADPTGTIATVEVPIRSRPP